MKFDIAIIGLILVGTCAALVTEFLRVFYHKKFKRALVFKGLASACFIAFGAYNFFSREFSWVTLAIFVGICWGIVGDEIIALCQIYPKSDIKHFIGGGACFIVGHILYLIALLMLAKVSFIAVALVFVLILFLCVLYERQKTTLTWRLKTR